MYMLHAHDSKVALHKPRASNLLKTMYLAGFKKARDHGTECHVAKNSRRFPYAEGGPRKKLKSSILQPEELHSNNHVCTHGNISVPSQASVEN